MAHRHLRSFLPIILVFALALPIGQARAESLRTADLALPALQTFARQVMNGQADQLRGVYAPDLFADSVVPQPAGDPAFVSNGQYMLTQFSSASRLGSIGLLAHDFLAGAQFSRLQNGHLIYLVYGDGRTASYVVTEMLRYQALQPNSVYSDFVDLRNGNRIGASALFSSAYGRRSAVVLQTCITAEGSSSWGRLFVVAQPYSDPGISHSHRV